MAGPESGGLVIPMLGQLLADLRTGQCSSGQPHWTVEPDGPGGDSSLFTMCDRSGTSRLKVMGSLADAIDAIRPCVVQVSVGGDGVRPVPVGTGFIVDSAGFVLTARHVARDVRNVAASGRIQNSRFLIGLAQPNTDNMRANFNFVGFEIVEEDPRHDLALLQMRPNPFEGNVNSGIVINGNLIPLLFDTAARSADRPRDGLPIAVSGYPLSQTVLITTSGAVASAWAMDIQNVALPGAPSGFTVPDIKDSYLADVSVNPGNSGGPVYRVEDAAVIGVCVAFRPVPIVADKGPVVVNGDLLAYNSGLSIVVPIRYGDELLTRHLDGV